MICDKTLLAIKRFDRFNFLPEFNAYCYSQSMAATCQYVSLPAIIFITMCANVENYCILNTHQDIVHAL